MGVVGVGSVGFGLCVAVVVGVEDNEVEEVRGDDCLEDCGPKGGGESGVEEREEHEGVGDVLEEKRDVLFVVELVEAMLDEEDDSVMDADVSDREKGGDGSEEGGVRWLGNSSGESSEKAAEKRVEEETLVESDVIGVGECRGEDVDDEEGEQASERESEFSLGDGSVSEERDEIGDEPLTDTVLDELTRDLVPELLETELDGGVDMVEESSLDGLGDRDRKPVGLVREVGSISGKEKAAVEREREESEGVAEGGEVHVGGVIVPVVRQTGEDGGREGETEL